MTWTHLPNMQIVNGHYTINRHEIVAHLHIIDMKWHTFHEEVIRLSAPAGPSPRIDLGTVKTLR